MSHSQPWMAAFFDILLRSPKTVYEKIPQAFFRRCQIAPTVHRSKNIVVWNLPVECRNQPRKAVLPDHAKDLVFFHQNDASNYAETVVPNSRHFFPCESATARQVMSPSNVFKPDLTALLSWHTRSSPRSANASK